ncbi:MAG: M20/M25/M40 family metallo-hydrolase [Scrofimicrobium sp.]
MSEARTDLVSAVDDAVNANLEEAIQLLSELVAVRSVNPKQPGVDGSAEKGGEARANDLLQSRLESLGMQITRVEAEPGRPNIEGRIAGSDPDYRSLAFAGHIDTVAPTRVGQLDPRVEDGRLFGLGTTDMKSGLVASWLAVKALTAAGVKLKGDLALHSVVGEETMDHLAGTSALLSQVRLPDAALVAEPTSSVESPLVVSNTAAGNYLFSVTVHGKSTHWASRNQAIRPGGGGDSVGVNAIDKGFYVYQALRQLEDQWGFSKSHPQFPAGAFIIHPGALKADVGFAAPAYFPDRARFDYLLSFPPGYTSEEIKDEITNHVRKAEALDPWLREHPSDFEWIDTWPPAYTDPTSDFVRVTLEARNEVAEQLDTRVQPEAVPAGAQSDASFYEAAGSLALVCGPGDLLLAHSPDESVDISFIASAAKMFARTAINWCGVNED